MPDPNRAATWRRLFARAAAAEHDIELPGLDDPESEEGDAILSALARSHPRARPAALEYADACAALGLTPPEPTTPGICCRPGCGQARSMTAASSYSATATQRQGYCSQACRRLDGAA